MADIEKVLETHRTAVDELLQAAEATAGTWELPRAPGKWSPSQLIEHLALSYDESAKLVALESSKFPIAPAFLRPVIRGLWGGVVGGLRQIPGGARAAPSQTDSRRLTSRTRRARRGPLW